MTRATVRKVRVFDAEGNEVFGWPDGKPIPTGYTVSTSAMFLDGKSAAPVGYYHLRDRHGRVAGVASLDGAAKVRSSYEDLKVRLAGAHKAHKLTPMSDADVTPAMAFMCASCGFRSKENHDRCPSCGTHAGMPSPSQLAYAAYKQRLASAHRHV